MSATDIDIQLKVWKDLAVSKQVLMSAATDALGLNQECSTKELKEALDNAIQKAKQADNTVIEIRAKSEQAIAEMKQQLDNATKTLKETEETLSSTQSALKAAEQQIEASRTTNADALKKARAEVTEHQNKLKSISKALADSPENVVKKLKNLKKQKMDEAKLRAQVEKSLKTAKKEKSDLEAELKQQKALVEKAATLVDQFRTLHVLSHDQNEKISSLSKDKTDLFDVPELDEDLLNLLKPAENDA